MKFRHFQLANAGRPTSLYLYTDQH